MSEEKVLTLRGKKAVWAPAGGGGGVQVVTITAVAGDSNYTYTSSHTGAEIAEMAKKGYVFAKIVYPDGDPDGMVAFAGVSNGVATFINAATDGSVSAIMIFAVPENDTAITFGFMS